MEESIKSLIDTVQISDPSFTKLEIIPSFYSFVICVLISFLVRFFYIKYSNSAVGKLNLGNIIPILSSIVFIVILVVKSSLALSLGLVGALSIVRFRTPIKEPEELVYLFLAIAIGLGCAANYTLITAILTIIILLLIYFFLSNKENLRGINEYSLNLSWNDKKIDLNNIFEVLDDSSSLSLLRYSVNQETNNAIFLIETDNINSINEIVEKIRKLDDNFSVVISPPNPSF